MNRNTFYVLDEELLAWRLENEPPVRWPECRYFGQVLTEVNRACPDLGLRFVLTKRLHGRLPLQGDDVVVICLADELASMPSYAHDVRLLAKMYGVQRRPRVSRAASPRLSALAATLAQEAIVQARRAPSLFRSHLRTARRGRKPATIDVPLGTYLLDDVPFVPFDERKFEVSYAGSRINRQKEAGRRVPTQKMRSRRELEDVLDRLAGSRPDLQLGVHIIDTFQDAVSHSDAYSQLLMNSQITLCPRGGSLETYRFFEAVRCGCVPVSEALPDRRYYTGAPGIRVHRWSELPEVVDRLLADGDGLRVAHEQVLRWWEDRCSPSATARSLIAALGAPLERGPSKAACEGGAVPGT